MLKLGYKRTFYDIRGMVGLIEKFGLINEEVIKEIVKNPLNSNLIQKYVKNPKVFHKKLNYVRLGNCLGKNYHFKDGSNKY